jgi:GNAT superfamily N-acetyltransferase
VYDCLYENETSQFWARPKRLFFSSLKDEDPSQPRFELIKPQITVETKISSENLRKVSQLLTQVFGPFDEKKIIDRLRGQNGKVALHMAHLEEMFVGFKLGYEKSPDTFYSWLGAVNPEFQGWGFGRALMAEQHLWCQENGYKVIETKTMNKWQNMLLLNLKFGFQIVALEKNDRDEIKIVMSKSLTRNPEN